MIDGLEARLHDLAAQGCVVTYGALAAQVKVEGPGRIARLTAALETLMETDTATGRPMRAALVVGRVSGGLPARGFFQKAQALGHDVSDPAAFHTRNLHALFETAP